MEDQQPASGDLTDGTPDEQDSAQDEDTAVDEAADATLALIDDFAGSVSIEKRFERYPLRIVEQFIGDSRGAR